MSRSEHETLVLRLAQQLVMLLQSNDLMKAIEVKISHGLNDRGFDFVAHGRTALGTELRFAVECKTEPRPVHFPSTNLSGQFERSGALAGIDVPVLGAPFIGPRMAQVCWDHGWGWFDLAGNARIKVPGLLYLEKTGQTSDEPRPRPRANLSTPQAGRVLRALLAPQNAGRTWSQLALHSHVARLPLPRNPVTPPSLGLVNKVVHELLNEKFIDKNTDGIRVSDPLALLEAWTSVYRFDRHLRTECFTLLKGPRLDTALQPLEAISGGHAAYAVFSAAERQAPNVRQPKAWVYVAARYQADFLKLAEAKPVDSGANLVVLNPDDDGVFYLQEGGSGEFVSTNPIQTYLDLSKAGGRGEEAAESILELQLRPAWQRAGLLK